MIKQIAMTYKDIDRIAQNVLEDPNSDSTAKMLASISVRQSEMMDTVAQINFNLFRMTQKVHAIESQQHVLIEELEQYFEGSKTSPNFARIREAAASAAARFGKVSSSYVSGESG